MAYDAITSAQIAAGEAVKQELLEKVKGNDADHESRLLVVEAALGRLPPIAFDVVGTLSAPLALDGALAYRVEADLTVTACRLFVKLAGTSGSVTVDVEYKRGGAAWTSILSAPISAAYGTGDYYTTSGTLTFQDFEAGDLIRLNIDAVQDEMEDFAVYLENESA